MNEMRYRSVVEETVHIDLPDSGGLQIKGILRGNFDQPIVIMMHGRPGWGNETLQYLGARYLYEQGFASLRLWMYEYGTHYRNQIETSLETLSSDFDVVVDYLAEQGVKQIFAVGHSYGGLTVLRSKSKLAGAVLWDPTHGSVWSEMPEYDPDFPMRTIDELSIGVGGQGFVTTVAAQKYDRALGDTTDWAAHKGYPLEVISAGKGSMTQLGKQYIDAADGPKAQVVIADASHQLDDSDEVVLQLFKETSDWFKGIKA